MDHAVHKLSAKRLYGRILISILGLATARMERKYLLDFKFRKCRNGNFYVSRIIYQMNGNNKQYHLLKKQKVEEALDTY